MDPSWLPENRRPHAQDVAFELLDSGCRPAGCCENTSCSKVTVRPDIPEQVASCADELPTGCYYYAKAVANVTGALCHHESLWSSASGVCFDLMGLGGWQAPIYSLWQIHNAYTEGCRHMQFSMHRNVTNVDKAALRSCSWSDKDAILPSTEMLMERSRKPLAMFTPQTISAPPPPAVTTIRVHSSEEDCVFHLDNYFEFPKLQLPLRLIVTSAPAVLQYIQDAMKKQDATLDHTTVAPDNTLLEQLYSEMVTSRTPDILHQTPHDLWTPDSSSASGTNSNHVYHPGSIKVTSGQGLWDNVTHDQLVAIYTDYVRSHITGPDNKTPGELRRHGYLSAVSGASVTSSLSQSRRLSPLIRPPFSRRRIPLLLSHHNHRSLENSATLNSHLVFLLIFLTLYSLLK